MLKPILIVEIESGSVAAALVFIGQKSDHCPEVKYYHRENFSYNHEQSGQGSRDFFNLLFSTIEKTLKIIARQIKSTERPTIIHCFSGSPLLFSQTKHLNIESDGLFKITHSLIREHLDNSLAVTAEQFAVSNPLVAKDQIKVVESKLVKIYANGYEVTNPYNLKVKKMGLAHFSSLASGQIINRINSLFAGFYPDLEATWHSTAFALASALNLNPESPHHFMIISVGGLNTELIIIRNQLLEEIVSIPFGEETLVQKLSAKTNRQPADVRALFALQVSVGVNPDIGNYPANLLAEIKKDWAGYFNQGIDILTNRIFLPKNILVVGHDFAVDLIASWIETEDFTKATRSQSALSAKLINPTYFNKKCVFPIASKAALDIHLMAEIIFCDTLIKLGNNL